jgi:molybdenum cofactor cytidylyltransferase
MRFGHEIWAIILAAGESTRMKTNKLLLPFNDKLMITMVIDIVRQSDVDQLLLVLGAFKDEMLAAIAGMPVKHCYTQDFKQGMLSSVQCGFRNLPDFTDAALVFLGDQPMISAEVVNRIIKEYQSSKKGILVPVYNGRRGHPVLIDKKYGKAIEGLDPSEGLHALISQFGKDVQEVEVTVPGILRDIDTIQDYLNETKFN